MVVYQDFSGRVKELRSHFKMNQAEFATLMKTHGSTISDFESGNRVPSKEFIITLSEIGISTDWFLTGVGPMLKPTNGLNDVKNFHEKALKRASPLPDESGGNTIESAQRKPPGVPLILDGDSELADGIVIPLLENAASAGYGSELGDEDAPARYVRVPQFLAKYPHLASLPVKGDSMEPTLHDGDLVVCDGGGWDGDGIYVLKTFETAYIKRVQLTSKGYEVISDNKMYQSFTESVEALSIVGKVRAILVIVPGRRGGV
jgi:phage repressor protein C with HTH and peptisase S24 domain